MRSPSPMPPPAGHDLPPRRLDRGVTRVPAPSPPRPGHDGAHALADAARHRGATGPAP